MLRTSPDLNQNFEAIDGVVELRDMCWLGPRPRFLSSRAEIRFISPFDCCYNGQRQLLRKSIQGGDGVRVFLSISSLKFLASRFAEAMKV